MTKTSSMSTLNHHIVTAFRRYTPANGKRPSGTVYGVDGWLFTLPAERIGLRSFTEENFAVYQLTVHAQLVWQVRQVGKPRVQIGGNSSSRRKAVDVAVGLIAAGREEQAGFRAVSEERNGPVAKAGKHPAARGPRPRIEWDDDALIEDYTVRQMSTPALGRKYGVHHASVHRRLLKLADDGRVHLRDDREARLASRPQLTVNELADPAAVLGVTAARLQEVLVEYRVIAAPAEAGPTT